MDMITLAMAKAYTDQKAGYTEPGKVYTFDGNAEETKKYGNITYAKIADTAPNLHNVTKAVYTAPNGSTIEYSSEKLTVDDVESQGKIIGQRIKASLGGQTAAVIILDNTGLWVYAQPGYGYCSLIEFAETVHPIDQKFIPPVDSLTINGTDGKQYKLTVDENGALAVTVVE